MRRKAARMFDLLIRGGTVLDGSGGPARVLDLGVREGRIAALVPHLEGQAGQILEARGKTVCPGFLDIHRHADLAVFRRDFGELELRQGLTTIINGNCGMSAAPFGPAWRDAILDYLSPVIGMDDSVPNSSMRAYLEALARRPLPLHVGILAGAGVMRADAAGFAAGALSPAQLRSVHRSIETALAEGALGVSLGLGYAPDCFYDTQGLILALAPLAGGPAPITVHMRDEGSNVDRSVEEMLELARALRCPVELSHLKAIGRENWGTKIPRVLTMLKAAREEGLDIRWDVYPYTAGSTQLLHILPPEVLEGGTEALTQGLGDPAMRAHIRSRLATARDYNNISLLVGWENIFLSSLRQPENQALLGLSIPQAAALRRQDPVDFTLDLLRSEHCTVTMIDFITHEDDIAAILQSEAVSVISDATYPAAGKPHPRLYGNFPRVIERYVNQLGVLTLPEAIHKMTQAPADALGLRQKGRIAVGADADLLIFDPAAIHEPGSYLEPARLAEGMETVIVGGVPAILEGRLTGAQSGQVLRSR